MFLFPPLPPLPPHPAWPRTPPGGSQTFLLSFLKATRGWFRKSSFSERAPFLIARKAVAGSSRGHQAESELYIVLYISSYYK